jgi:hypothetical protein
MPMAINIAANPRLNETMSPRPNTARLRPTADDHDPQRFRAWHQSTGNAHCHQAASGHVIGWGRCE